MPDKDLHPFFSQALYIGTFRQIRSLHGIAQRMQHLGNAAHADSTNTDKMQSAYVLWHSAHIYFTP